MQLWVTVFSGGSHLHRMCWQSCWKFFFVVKWIDCFRAVCLCLWVCMSKSLHCKQDLPPPSNHAQQSPPVCVCDGSTHIFPWVTGYGRLSWQLVTMILFLCLHNKERGKANRLCLQNITGTSCLFFQTEFFNYFSINLCSVIILEFVEQPQITSKYASTFPFFWLNLSIARVSLYPVWRQ